MVWRRPGDKPLSEPMMVNLLTHICVTRPQWRPSLLTHIWIIQHWWNKSNDLFWICHRNDVCPWHKNNFPIIHHGTPDSKVHGANMGPTWIMSATDGPHIGPMNLAIRDSISHDGYTTLLCFPCDSCTHILQRFITGKDSPSADEITMMTSSNGNIFRVTGPLCGTSAVTGDFPTQRPVTRSFDVFFDLRLNKRLSKQSWGWWLETP